MAIWVVRAAGDPAKEGEALAAGRCIAGWDDIGDFRTFADEGALREAIKRLHPWKSNAGLAVWSGQMRRFRDAIVPGDVAVMPTRGGGGVLHVGLVEGDYDHGPAVEGGKPRHMRSVRWVGTLAKAEVAAEARGSIGAFLTVFRIDKPAFEAQVRAVVDKARRRAAPKPAGPAAAATRRS